MSATRFFLTVGLLTISTLELTAQQTNLEGIGIFKISKDTSSIIQELEKQLDTKCRKIYSMSDVFSLEDESKVVIAELFPDTVDIYHSPVRASFCSQVRVFFINKYIVAGITLNNIYLTFYNGYLTEFYSDITTELNEAMHLKYGDPVIENNVKEIECTNNNTGNTIKHKEQTIYQRWENGEIKAIAYLSNYYDSKCKEHFINYFMINKEGISSIISACDEKKKQDLKSRELKIKRNKLTDF
jgi:hypothetical protein